MKLVFDRDTAASGLMESQLANDVDSLSFDWLQGGGKQVGLLASIGQQLTGGQSPRGSSLMSVFPIVPVDVLWSSIIWRSPVWGMFYSDSGFIVHLLSLSLFLLHHTQALPHWFSGGEGTSWRSGGIERRVSII